MHCLPTVCCPLHTAKCGPYENSDIYVGVRTWETYGRAYIDMLQQWNGDGYLMVLERKTRGRLLHLAKHFGPKGPSSVAKGGTKHHDIMICFVPCLQLKKALLGPQRFAK